MTRDEAIAAMDAHIVVQCWKAKPTSLDYMEGKIEALYGKHWCSVLFRDRSSLLIQNKNVHHIPKRRRKTHGLDDNAGAGSGADRDAAEP